MNRIFLGSHVCDEYCPIRDLIHVTRCVNEKSPVTDDTCQQD